MIAADVPLEPGPEEARRLLERELAHPEYHRENLLARAINWILRKYDEIVAATSGSSLASVLAALVIAGLLIALLLWLVSRTRRTARSRRRAATALPEQRLTAAEHRRLAERALAAGDFATSVVEGFRALALAEIERGRIDDLPQATARELSVLLAEAHPAARERLADLAALFDDVRYGDRPATRTQAQSVLALDLGALRTAAPR